MLELEEQERSEVLNCFQEVIQHLRNRSDEKLLTAVYMLNRGKVAEATVLGDEAARIEHTLTAMKSYLESEYKQVVSLH